MSLDRRKIQTAVVHGPESAEPAYMPQDQDEAVDFREQSQRDALTFWCGALLGGCGQRLSVKVYTARDTIPHFAHLAGAGHCGRDNLGGSSADHLYAHRGLSHWLGTQGHAQQEPLPQIRLEEGRACTQMLITNPAQDHLPWRLVFDAANDPELIETAASNTADKCQWLVLETESDPNAHLRRILVQNKVRFQRFRLRSQGAARIMDIGEVRAATGQIVWTPLDNHVFSAGTLRLPRTDAEATLLSATVPVPRPKTAETSVSIRVMNALEYSLTSGDRAQMRSQLVRLKQLQNSRALPSSEHIRARDLVQRATEALSNGRDSAGSVRPPRSLAPAPTRAQVRRTDDRRRKDQARAQRRDESDRRRSAQEQLILLDRALQTDDMVEYARARDELELMLYKTRTPEDVKGTIRSRLEATPTVTVEHALAERHRWLHMNADSLINRLRRCETANDRITQKGIVEELRKLQSQKGVPGDLVERVDRELERVAPLDS